MASGDRLKWFLSKLGDVDFISRAQEAQPEPEEEAPEAGAIPPPLNPPPPPPGPADVPLNEAAFGGEPSPLEEPVQQDATGNTPLKDKVKFMALMNNKTTGAKPPKSALAGGGFRGY